MQVVHHCSKEIEVTAMVEAKFVTLVYACLRSHNKGVALKLLCVSSFPTKLREIDFLLKICWLILCLSPLWKLVILRSLSSRSGALFSRAGKNIALCPLKVTQGLFCRRPWSTAIVPLHCDWFPSRWREWWRRCSDVKATRRAACLARHALWSTSD